MILPTTLGCTVAIHSGGLEHLGNGADGKMDVDLFAIQPAYKGQRGGESLQMHTTVYWNRGVTSVRVIAWKVEEYRTSSMDVPSPTSDSGEAYRLHDLVRLRLPPTPRFTPTEVQNPARVRIGRCFGITCGALDSFHSKGRSACL